MANRRVAIVARAASGVLPRRPRHRPADTRTRDAFSLPPVGEAFTESYRVEGHVEIGEASALLAAWDVEHGREVAIRVLSPARVAKRSLLAFWDEARVRARVRHPNLAATYAFGLRRGCPYVVAEAVPGESGVVWMAGRSATVEHSVVVLDQLCAAMEALHAGGVVHGDLHWRSVRIGWHLSLRVIDVGVARMLSGGGDSRTAMEDDVIAVASMAFELLATSDACSSFAAALSRGLANDTSTPSVAGFRELLRQARLEVA